MRDNFRDGNDASPGADAAPSTMDATAPQDAARLSDATVDVRDALPPLDTGSTPQPSACPDAAATLIYLISQDRRLFSFYPPSLDLQAIGTVQCTAQTSVPSPDGGLLSTPNPQPNSMAVNREGMAFVAYNNGQIFQVSLTNASCSPTNFFSTAARFGDMFGMAYAASGAAGGETLFLAENSGASARLATVDLRANSLTLVGTIDPAIQSPELSGDAAGDLFAFFQVDNTGSAIARVDQVTAKLTNQSSLPGILQHATGGSGAWAFGFWSGDFYTFTDDSPPPQIGSVVTRFRPSDGTVVRLIRLNGVTIVGAGVSTCAPQ